MRTVRNEVMALSKEQCLEMHEAIQNRTANMSRKFREILAERIAADVWDPEPVSNVDVILAAVDSFRKNGKESDTEPLMAVVSDAVYDDIALNGDVSKLADILIIPFSNAKDFIDLTEVPEGSFLISFQRNHKKLTKHMNNILENLKNQKS